MKEKPSLHQLKETSWAIAELMPNVIRGAQLDFFAKNQVTQTQFLVLAAIFSYKRCTMGHLAGSLHVTMPTMSGIVERLVQAKYVQRVENPEDRREVRVHLTKAGAEIIAKFQEAVSQRWEVVLQGLNNDDVKTMAGIIGKLKGSLRPDGVNNA